MLIGINIYTVAIIFANKDGGQLPQLRNVVRFKYLSLIGSTVTVQCQTNPTILFVLASQCNTCTKWNLYNETELLRFHRFPDDSVQFT